MTLKGWRYFLNKVLLMPQRYVLGVMGFFASAIFFMMRTCLDMTLPQMVLKASEVNTLEDNQTMISINLSNNNRITYDWDKTTQGFLLSAFYYGYVITHLPGGLLAEKFGSKWIIGMGVLCSSLATLITPWAIHVDEATGLFIIRAIKGFGEGFATPAFLLILSRWIPPSERSRFGVIVFGGAQIGNIAGPFISSYIILAWNSWAYVYYCFGLLGLLWFIFWVLFCYNTPNSHPFISDKERVYLNENIMASGLHKKLDPVPFKAILRSAPFWVLIFAAAAQNWTYLTMNANFPKELPDILKLDTQETGFIAALPYLSVYVSSLIFAAINDFCIKKKWYNITMGRKIYASISSSLPAIFMVLAAYSRNRIEAVGFFIASMCFLSASYSSIKINTLDISPNFTGTTTAFVNGISAISGIASPFLVHAFGFDKYQWKLVYWIGTTITLVTTNILYLIWGSGDQQWWDDVDKHGYPDKWKLGPLKKIKTIHDRRVVYPKHDHSPLAVD